MITDARARAVCLRCLYYGDLSFTHPRRWSSTVSWRSSTTLNHTQGCPKNHSVLSQNTPNKQMLWTKISLSNWNWQTRHKGKVLQMHVLCPMSHWPPAAPPSFPPSFRPSFFLFVLMMLLIHSFFPPHLIGCYANSFRDIYILSPCGCASDQKEGDVIKGVKQEAGSAILRLYLAL